MTAQEMLDNLGSRLEDPSKKAFPPAFRLQSLENAQIVVASLFPNDLLTSLEVVDSNESVSSSKVALTNLTYDVLKGIMGIVNVKNYNGLWCNIINIGDLKSTESGLYTPSTQFTLAYLFANAVYPLPTSLTALDIYYLKMPKPLRHAFTMAANDPASTTTFIGDASQGLSALADVYNGAVIYNVLTGNYHIVTDYAVTTRTFTVSPARSGATTWSNADTFYFVTGDFFLLNLDNVTCELDSSFHDIVVTLAEVECWLRKNSLERANKALEIAYSDIQSIISQRNEITGIGE